MLPPGDQADERSRVPGEVFRLREIVPATDLDDHFDWDTQHAPNSRANSDTLGRLIGAALRLGGRGRLQLRPQRRAARDPLIRSRRPGPREAQGCHAFGGVGPRKLGAQHAQACPDNSDANEAAPARAPWTEFEVAATPPTRRSMTESFNASARASQTPDASIVEEWVTGFDLHLAQAKRTNGAAATVKRAFDIGPWQNRRVPRSGCVQADVPSDGWRCPTT